MTALRSQRRRRREKSRKRSRLLRMCRKVAVTKRRRMVGRRHPTLWNSGGGTRWPVQVDPIKPTLKAPGTKGFDTKI